MYLVIETDRNRGAGLQGYAARIDGLARRGEDVAPAFEAIRQQFYRTERGIFASQGGGKWEPLTARYLAAKSRRGQDSRIERATGELAKALGSGQGPTAVHTVTEDEMTLGVDAVKAVVSQRGSGRRRRRLVTIDARRRSKWVGTMRGWIIDGKPGGDS